MDSLHRDEFAEYFHDSQHATIVQVWSEATASMSEEEFRSGVKRLAELIEREKLHNVLVDVARMAYGPRADFEEWRQTNIIPRYNAAGVRKFAFVLPAGATAVVENGVAPAPEGKATFPFGYFGSREAAFAWLVE
jgi:hypothetical protein